MPSVTGGKSKAVKTAPAKAPAQTPAKTPAKTAKAVKPAKATKAAAATAPKAPAKPRKKRVPRVDPTQRQHYIEVAAYYIAERRGFLAGCEAEDWAEAEREIDELLREGKLNA